MSNGEATHANLWLQLPQDLVFEIFLRVGAVDTANSASLVCRSWHKHSQAAALWKAFSKEDFATYYNGLPEAYHPKDWHATYRYLFDVTMNSPKEVVFKLGEISCGTELEPHQIGRLLNICRTISQAHWADRVASADRPSWIHSHVRENLIELLMQDELGIVKIKSRRVYTAVFDAAIHAVSYFGLSHPDNIYLDDEYAFEMMRVKFERLNTLAYARTEIMTFIAGFALFIVFVFSPLGLMTKLLASSTILTPLVAIAPPPFAWMALYRISLPLLFCHFTLHSHSKIASTIAYALIQLSGPLLKVSYPWFVSVMFALGWAVRTWTNLELGLGSAGPIGSYILFRGVVGGLMSCQMLGFCFDASKQFGLKMREFIAARPRLASICVTGIRLANRYFRLGSSWATAAGNLTWTPMVSAETRAMRYHNRNNYLFPVERRKRTKTFVAVASSVLGCLFAVAAFVQQKYQTIL